MYSCNDYRMLSNYLIELILFADPSFLLVRLKKNQPTEADTRKPVQPTIQYRNHGVPNSHLKTVIKLESSLHASRTGLHSINRARLSQAIENTERVDMKKPMKKVQTEIAESTD